MSKQLRALSARNRQREHIQPPTSTHPERPISTQPHSQTLTILTPTQLKPTTHCPPKSDSDLQIAPATPNKTRPMSSNSKLLQKYQKIRSQRSAKYDSQEQISLEVEPSAVLMRENTKIFTKNINMTAIVSRIPLENPFIINLNQENHWSRQRKGIDWHHPKVSHQVDHSQEAQNTQNYRKYQKMNCYLSWMRLWMVNPRHQMTRESI